MHDCKTVHPKKSHRRRNRALRKALAPLRWFASEVLAEHPGWGALALAPVRTSFSFRFNRHEVAPAGLPAGKPIWTQDTPRIQVAPASMLRRLAAVVKRPFLRKPSV